MIRSWLRIFTPLACLFFSLPVLAQSTPEAAYEKFVQASRAGDIQALLAVSTTAKVKEFNEEIATDPQKLAEIKKIMVVMAPKSYKIKKTEIAPGSMKASLFLDALAMDFFSMNDPKAKPVHEDMEVLLVKEGGEWKVDKQCGGKDGCGKEPEWTKVSWGKDVPLGDGKHGVKISTGKAGTFSSVTLQGKPFVANVSFNFPENASLFYFLHRSPNFSEIYLKVGEEKLTPVAAIEDFPINRDEKSPPKVKPLEEGVSYSQSNQFSGIAGLSLLFDIPPQAKGAKVLYVTLTFDDKKLSYEVR